MEEREKEAWVVRHASLLTGVHVDFITKNSGGYCVCLDVPHVSIAGPDLVISMTRAGWQEHIPVFGVAFVIYNLIVIYNCTILNSLFTYFI